jgi:hypothetical protein
VASRSGKAGGRHCPADYPSSASICTAAQGKVDAACDYTVDSRPATCLCCYPSRLTWECHYTDGLGDTAGAAGYVRSHNLSVYSRARASTASVRVEPCPSGDFATYSQAACLLRTETRLSTPPRTTTRSSGEVVRIQDWTLRLRQCGRGICRPTEERLRAPGVGVRVRCVALASSFCAIYV